MKKRHEQKLVVLSGIILLMINVPFILIFDLSEDFFGIPIIYIYLLCVWLFAILISYIILRRHYE